VISFSDLPAWPAPTGSSGPVDGLDPGERSVASRTAGRARRWAVVLLLLCSLGILAICAGPAGLRWLAWVQLWLAAGIGLAVAPTLAWAQPSRRQRWLTLHASASVTVCGVLIGIWVISSAGAFWPAYPIVALGIVLYIHASRGSGDRRDLVRQIERALRSRRGALDAQAAELRRIERDLHDGAQARIVALSMHLGRVEERLQDRPELAVMVREARQQATGAVAELRDLARGIAPPVLADRGLAAAVQSLAHRTPAPVHVSADVDERLSPLVESTGYFVVSEGVTNALKHAPAAPISIALSLRGTSLHVSVADQGPGGADPAGSGLTGLRQRVEALDGRLVVRSPVGKGTEIEALLPCA
jgi:signal transduction histidine kinase